MGPQQGGIRRRGAWRLTGAEQNPPDRAWLGQRAPRAPPDGQLPRRDDAHLGLHLDHALHAGQVVLLHVVMELEQPGVVCARAAGP